jgi:hypothetical protein
VERRGEVIMAPGMIRYRLSLAAPQYFETAVFLM